MISSRKARRLLGRLVYIVFSALVLAFFGLPLLWLVLAPFNARGTLSVAIPQPFTLDNFRQVFQNQFAVRSLLQNNPILAIGTMRGVTLIATLTA